MENCSFGRFVARSILRAASMKVFSFSTGRLQVGNRITAFKLKEARISPPLSSSGPCWCCGEHGCSLWGWLPRQWGHTAPCNNGIHLVLTKHIALLRQKCTMKLQGTTHRMGKFQQGALGRTAFEVGNYFNYTSCIRAFFGEAIVFSFLLFPSWNVDSI